MTVYYIDPVNGSDSNNGLGPDASHASNKPWISIGKALGASGIASGDTVYLAPGTYRQTVTVAMTSATVETQILGDPANAQGFKTSGGVRVAPGDVTWTCYETSDTATPASSNVMSLAGRDFLTFKYINLVGTVLSTTTNSISITFQYCTFLPGSTGGDHITYTGLADIAANWTIDSCILIGANNRMVFTLPTSTTADYDSNIQIKNCLNINGSQNLVTPTPSGANSFKGGGVDVLNCTYFGNGNVMQIASANLSTSIPCTVYNCISFGGALSANTSGQIVEDYNHIWAGTPRTNVSTGANSTSGTTKAMTLEIGQALMGGRMVRPFLMPRAGSPFLGFGNQGGAPSVDLLNRARPSGGGSTSNAIGALERHDTAAQETSTVRTGSNAINITGPGDHEFDVPVDATSTTITVYARYDSTHAATNKPQMSVVNGEEAGVTSATATMTAAADTWEQLTLSFTPARAGIVTVRLISRAAAGNGKAFFDDFALA